MKEGVTNLAVYTYYPEEVYFSWYSDEITVKVVSEPEMNYTDGIFSITSDYGVTPTLALYKEGIFIDAIKANELDISGIEFDEMSVMHLSLEDDITPIVPKISLTRKEISALPALKK